MSALPRSQSVSVSRSRDRRRERGFTFIEILIVMGIISVLVGGVIVAMQIWNKKGPEFATTQVVAKAQGDGARFDQLLTEYEKAPKVTRERLYIDAMQSVMTNSSKVMIDVETGNNMFYVPLDKIIEQGNAARSTTTPQLTPQQLRDLSDQLNRDSTSAADRARTQTTTRSVR